MSQMFVGNENFSAEQLLDDALYAATGVRGLGRWAAGLYNTGITDPQQMVRMLRYNLDQSELGQQAYANYLNTFPGMDRFLAQGIFSGNNPEQQYMDYRATVKEAAARYNINPDLISNDRLAQFIENRTSAAELVSRMNMAATAVATLPPDVLQTMQQYYNINMGDLTSFYVDPELTEAVLQQKTTAAQIGTEAVRQNIGVTQAFAEELAQRGFNEEAARQGFQQVSGGQELTSGMGDLTNQQELLSAAFGNEQASRNVRRVAAARAGRFQGGGQFVGGQEGVSGLGSAAT